MMRIITNHVPRDVIDAHDLTLSERDNFDYLDWPAIDEGRESASFIRYRGELLDLGEFMRGYGLARNSGLPESLRNWDGYASDSAFSATVVRFVDNGERVVVGRVLT